MVRLLIQVSPPTFQHAVDLHGRGSVPGVAEENQEVQTLKISIGFEGPLHNKSVQGHQYPETDLYRRLLSLVHWFASCRASGTITYSADEGQSCHTDLPSMLQNLCLALLPPIARSWAQPSQNGHGFPQTQPPGKSIQLSPCQPLQIC